MGCGMGGNSRAMMAIATAGARRRTGALERGTCGLGRILAGGVDFEERFLVSGFGFLVSGNRFRCGRRGGIREEGGSLRCAGWTRRLPLRELFPALLLAADYEVHRARLIWGDGYGFFPGFWFGEERAAHSLFRQDVVGLLASQDSPAFVPGNDLIGSGRNVGELELSAVVGDGVVRM